MQRGCVSTLAASPKMARERSAESEIAANAAGGCNMLEGWAEPKVDPTIQKSNVMAGPARMSPHFMEDNWGPPGTTASRTRLTFPSRFHCSSVVTARTNRRPGLWLSR